MCGIAGYFAHSGASQGLDECVLRDVRDRMRSRGPDGDGLWIADDRRVGLAHRRLAIIDLSEHGAQPMHDDAARYSIVFNGEIYNYRELQAELEATGERFCGHSDTEVILKLFAREGENGFARLRGMFAIGIWDARDRRLTLARDPYGIKPLYIADQNGCVRFASQVKALLADPALSRDIDPAGLAGFQLWGSVPEPFTLYRAISALPAGHILSVDAGGVSAPRPFASVARVIAEARQRPIDQEEVADALRDSVRAHLIADVETGIFLSGGVDSGALLGLMADVAPAPSCAVTLRFEELAGTAADETPFAVEAARHYGARHHLRTITADEFRADLSDILDAMDQPSIDGINSWFVSKAVRELGLKVALSGLGGDELLAGYSTFSSIPATRRRFGALASIPGAGRAARLALKAMAPGFIARNPKAAGVLDHANSWAGSYMLRRAVMLPDEIAGQIDGDLMVEGLRRLAPEELVNAAITPEPSHDIGRVAALEAGNYMRNQLLRDADWAGMAHGLEIRVPLVDYWLLQRVAPMMASLNDGAGKALLANAPGRPLPAMILDKPKTGFSIPVAAWLLGRTRHLADRRDARDWAGRVRESFVGASVASNR